MLQLTEEQTADLLSARRRLLKKHIDIQEERVRIVRRMHVSLELFVLHNSGGTQSMSDGHS